MVKSSAELKLDTKDFEKQLLRLSADFPEAVDTALDAGAEYYKGALVINTPESNRKSLHLKDTSLIKNGKDADSLIPSRRIGFTRGNGSLGWRAHFPNSGTIHQPAQNFIEDTNEATEDNVNNIVLDVLRSWLNDRG